MAETELVERAFDQWVQRTIARHCRALLKAPVISVMAMFATSVFSGLIGKALIIGAICFFAALFATWRRFLEPLSFWAFVVAIAYWCDNGIIAHVKTALVGATRIN